MKSNIKDLISTLFSLDEYANSSEKIDNQKKLDILKELYILENQIHEARLKLKLPQLDNQYYSGSVMNSFNRPIEPDKVNVNETYIFTDYYRAIDYQYYLLGFLLLENNQINPGNLMLHQIIRNFVNRIIDKSLQYEDIIRTPSGATRCHTNLRFAMQFLRDAGLLKEQTIDVVEVEDAHILNTKRQISSFPEEDYEVKVFRRFVGGYDKLKDKKSKRTWALSYLGFWVAISFMEKEADKRNLPTTVQLSKTTVSNYFLNTDPIIWERIKEIIQEKYFKKLWSIVEKHVNMRPTEDKPEVIINAYYRLYSKLAQKPSKAELTKIKKEIEEIEKRNNLIEFMENIAQNFDAKKVFNIPE